MPASPPAKPLFDLKSTAWTLTALRLQSADLGALVTALDQRFADSPGLFDDDAVVLDLSPLRESDAALDLAGLLPHLRRHGMKPIAAQGGNAAQMAAARAAGLAEATGAAPGPAAVSAAVSAVASLSASGAARAVLPPVVAMTAIAPPNPGLPPARDRVVREPARNLGLGGATAATAPSAAAPTAAAPSAAAVPAGAAALASTAVGDARPSSASEADRQAAAESATAALPTMVVDKPLRSGQRVYARGADLVVLAVVSFGAEVIADGNIHVYGPLRGRAIAGARGNTGARIFSTCMEPQLVSIAGIYRTTETPLPAAVLGHAAQVRLDGEKIIVEPLSS